MIQMHCFSIFLNKGRTRTRTRARTRAMVDKSPLIVHMVKTTIPLHHFAPHHTNIQPSLHIIIPPSLHTIVPLPLHNIIPLPRHNIILTTPPHHHLSQFEHMIDIHISHRQIKCIIFYFHRTKSMTHICGISLLSM